MNRSTELLSNPSHALHVPPPTPEQFASISRAKPDTSHNYRAAALSARNMATLAALLDQPDTAAQWSEFAQMVPRP